MGFVSQIKEQVINTGKGAPGAAEIRRETSVVIGAVGRAWRENLKYKSAASCYFNGEYFTCRNLMIANEATWNTF